MPYIVTFVILMLQVFWKNDWISGNLEYTLQFLTNLYGHNEMGTYKLQRKQT